MAKKAANRKAQVFDAKAFGQAVKTQRTIQSCSTRQVAETLGIPKSHSTISRIERFLPSDLTVILLVCDWLGRSICDFIIYEKIPK